MAIGAGMIEGLSLGSNTQAAYVTRALAEMRRLGKAFGARDATFMGLSGLGDLVLTCTGPLSRNRQFGVELAQGKKAMEIVGGQKAVVEGYYTIDAAYRLSKTRAHRDAHYRRAISHRIREQRYTDLPGGYHSASLQRGRGLKRPAFQMSTIIIACNTIADELNLAIQATGVTHPVLWIDSKLHTRPEKLKEQIQGAISRISNVSTIILAFGYCGNALVGIKSETARLIFPKAEDCISLLLGSTERRRALSKETCSYYLTRGWMESENNLADEYAYCVRKFGHGARTQTHADYAQELPAPHSDRYGSL